MIDFVFELGYLFVFVINICDIVTKLCFTYGSLSLLFLSSVISSFFSLLSKTSCLLLELSSELSLFLDNLHLRNSLGLLLCFSYLRSRRTGFDLSRTIDSDSLGLWTWYFNKLRFSNWKFKFLTSGNLNNRNSGRCWGRKTLWNLFQWL